MADGVDEIAARLVVEGVDEHDPGRREFHDWSIVGLLPMPKDAFLDDFDPSTGRGWWYHSLDDMKQKPLIRLMPLQTLSKPMPPSAAYSHPEFYTEADLRRSQEGSNPIRTAHYEQLGMVLAERSTVLIAVMPESEKPDRPGGTAQVVSHRLNGWRPGWPPTSSRMIAEASDEIMVPAPLATPASNDVWLVPIGGDAEERDPVDLRVLRWRAESDQPWPEPSLFASPVRRSILRWPRQAHPEVLIRCAQRDIKAARRWSPLLRSIDVFNCRSEKMPPRQAPPWDDTISAHPANPELWSALAGAERIRGTLSDIQRSRKSRVQRTVTQLALIAALPIGMLELYAELFERVGSGWLLRLVPVMYVILVLVAVLLYRKTVASHSPRIAEEYRLLAEALRVQIVWWRMGLIARRDRVDNVILRYDTGGGGSALAARAGHGTRRHPLLPRGACRAFSDQPSPRSGNALDR